jgi:RNA polymerase sigma-70 factor, ECF subfamily
LDDWDDVRLAQDLLSGSSQAFERFVDLYHGRLFQYAYLMCGQREDAEEVSQDTLLHVFRTIHQLRDPSRLKAWVFRIAKNACLMKRRKSVFAPSRTLSLEELMPARFKDNGTIDLADWSQLPETGVLRSELQSILNHAVSELPEIYRAVLLLRDVEGLNTADTASILQVNEATVKQRLHRARLAVRVTVDGYLRGRESENYEKRTQT